MADAETMKDLNVADLVAASKAGDWNVPLVDEELAARLEADPTDEAVAAAISEIEAGKAAKGADGAQAGGGGATETRAQGEQTWVVQSSAPGAGHGQMWTDVGEVTVPPRTKRKTIVEKALAENPGAAPAQDADYESLFRVLDADSAATIPVRWEVPPAPEPVLKVG